jgi:colanic acid biosynthesis glycosyl transferase WcaI
LPKAVVLYHFLPPDEVVSAVLFGELSASLVEEGWEVTAFPSNRSIRNEPLKYSSRENWHRVEIHRLWRPQFSQSSGSGRILNAAWMLARWSILGMNPRWAPDVLIVGTDPILSVLVAIIWRKFRPKTKIVHWCFDLYPEAAIADGILKADSSIVRLLRVLLTKAYAACDQIVDIGPCMRKRLESYETHAPMVTIVPWALSEPECAVQIDWSERRYIFGEANLALLYSGNFGKAHSFADILDLARIVRNTGIKVAFSVAGNGAAALREALELDDTNVSVVPPAPAERLAERLSSADIHIVSLKQEWTGTVVPSKFFGALAVGRPVLFCGSEESAIAQWITEFKVGWVLAPGQAEQTATELLRFISNRSEVEDMFSHCHHVYTEHFSKAVKTSEWNDALLRLLEARTRPPIR